jgi:hypothetical protein
VAIDHGGCDNDQIQFGDHKDGLSIAAHAA